MESKVKVAVTKALEFMESNAYSGS